MNGREDDYNLVRSVRGQQPGDGRIREFRHQQPVRSGRKDGRRAGSIRSTRSLQSEEEGGQKELADTFAALQQFPDYNNAFVELQAGSIDAVAMDIGVAKYQLESRGEGYKILDEHLNSEKYAIGFKKGNTELCDKVNEGLQQVLADGTFDKLAEKYGIADMVCLEKKGE